MDCSSVCGFVVGVHGLHSVCSSLSALNGSDRRNMSVPCKGRFSKVRRVGRSARVFKCSEDSSSFEQSNVDDQLSGADAIKSNPNLAKDKLKNIVVKLRIDDPLLGTTFSLGDWYMAQKLDAFERKGRELGFDDDNFEPTEDSLVSGLDLIGKVFGLKLISEEGKVTVLGSIVVASLVASPFIALYFIYNFLSSSIGPLLSGNSAPWSGF